VLKHFLTIKILTVKTKLFLFGSILTLLLFCRCNEDEVAPIVPSRLEANQFESQTIIGNPIGTPPLRDMVVYLPPGYEADNEIEYPVVYLLHGLPHTDSFFISKEKWDPWVGPEKIFKTYPDFPEEGFQTWVDNLIETGKIDPMIIVTPDASCSVYGISWYTNSIVNGGFEDYIAEDLVEFMDSNYKTIANKDGRVLIGFSQGGYGAFKLAMKHPDKFCAMASHGAPLVFESLKAFAPSIMAENPDGLFGSDLGNKPMTSVVFTMAAAWSPNLFNPPFFIDFPFEYPTGNAIESVWDKWLEHDPFTMLDTYGANLKSLKGVYLDSGKQDEFGFWLAYDFFNQKLNAFGVNYTYELFDGGHFDQMFSRLEVSLKFCSTRMHN
jgi:enterochelin esterase-like enzyme